MSTQPKPHHRVVEAVEIVSSDLGLGLVSSERMEAATLIESRTRFSELVEVLDELCDGVEQWNNAVANVIGRQPVNTMTSLSKARALLDSVNGGKP